MASQMEELKLDSEAPAPGFMAPGNKAVSRRMMMGGDEEAPAPGFMMPETAATGPSTVLWHDIDWYRGVDPRVLIKAIQVEYKHPSFFQSIMGEWFATSLFLFFLILSVMPGKDDANNHIWRISLTAGFMIMILVYCFYAVSGGNMNPAVSWGLALSGRMTPVRAAFYTIAQMVGAITGCFAAWVVNPKEFMLCKGGANGFQLNPNIEGVNNISIGGAIWGEMIATMLLVMVVLFATDIKRTIDHIHMTTLIPLTIGVTVMVGHFVLLPYTGCSINPARSFGSAVIANEWEHHWIWWVGPALGSIVGSFLYKALFLPTEVAAIMEEGKEEEKGLKK